MSEQENYGEPWHQIGNDHVIYTPNDIRVAGGVDGRFAKRIIACVNLLRGVSTTDIEEFLKPGNEEHAEIIRRSIVYMAVASRQYDWSARGKDKNDRSEEAARDD